MNRTQKTCLPLPHQKAELINIQNDLNQIVTRSSLSSQNAILDLDVDDPLDFIRKDLYLRRRVLVEMVLLQEKEKRELIKQDGPAPPVITERFLWSNYPELLAVLKDPVNTRNFFAHSLKYNNNNRGRGGSTSTSITKMNNKAFSATMVPVIRKAAFLHGYQIDEHMTDVRIRDKIFDYYMELWKEAQSRLRHMERTGRLSVIRDVICKIEINCDSLLSKRKSKKSKFRDPPATSMRVSSRQSRAKIKQSKLQQQQQQHQLLLSSRKPNVDSSTSSSCTNVLCIEHVVREGFNNETEEWLPIAQCYLESFLGTFVLPTSTASTSVKLHRCRALVALVKTRLRNGMTRSAIYACHQCLREAYQHARQQYRGTIVVSHDVAACTNVVVDSAMVAWRDEIACLWCTYAHVLWHIGKLIHKTSSTHGETLLLRKSGDEWCKRALQTLVQAIQCPLVGNKACLSIILSRLMLTYHADRCRNDEYDDDDSAVSISVLHDTIRQCLDICKDAINRAHCRTNVSFFQSASCTLLGRDGNGAGGFVSTIFTPPPNFCVTQQSLFTKDMNISTTDLQESFVAVAKLPEVFQVTRTRTSSLSSSTTQYLYIDRGSVADIAKEMNQLSRLGECPTRISLNRLQTTVWGHGCLAEDSCIPLYYNTHQISKQGCMQQDCVHAIEEKRNPSHVSPNPSCLQPKMGPSTRAHVNLTLAA